MKTLKSNLVTSVVLLALAANAPAYDTLSHKWSSASPLMRVSGSSFPSGSSSLDALEEALDAWNLNPSEFRFSRQLNESSVSMANFQNEIWASSSTVLFDADDAATTFTWGLAGSTVVADVIFNTAMSWSVSHTKTTKTAYDGDNLPFQNVAIHELGHALGLDHEDGTYNVMGDAERHVNAHGNTLNYYPGEDAVNGAVALYGLDSTHREDVAVVHWKYRSDGGEYSQHERTTLYRLDGAEIRISSQVDGDPIREVSAGHNVLLQLTFENNGASTQEPLVHYYLSTDASYSSSDTYLGSSRPELQRSKVFTTDASNSKQITIPTGVTSNQIYYLIAVVDPNDDIDEVNEDNNITYTAIRIK